MDTLLSMVNRTVDQIDPLSRVLESFARHILPTATAKTGTYCYGYCGQSCNNHYKTIRFIQTDCGTYGCHTQCGCATYGGAC